LTCEELKKECIRRIEVAEVLASCVAALTSENPSDNVLRFSRGNADQPRSKRA
jgi:hypothetical protein